jgi:hypothetical protein
MMTLSGKLAPNKVVKFDMCILNLEIDFYTRYLIQIIIFKRM